MEANLGEGPTTSPYRLTLPSRKAEEEREEKERAGGTARGPEASDSSAHLRSPFVAETLLAVSEENAFLCPLGR